MVTGGLADGSPLARAERGLPGAVVTLTGVRLRGRERERDAPAADGISLSSLPGQSIALYDRAGDSGVELLDIVAGLRRPRSGQASVGGVAVHRPGVALREQHPGRRVLSGRFALLQSQSVASNVLAASRTRRADSAVRDRAAELLVLVGMADLAGRRADTLSAEQQWRVRIARSLLVVPRILLAEDPAPGLESRGARLVLDLLLDAHARYGFTLLLATSRLATTVRCERVVSLADGMLVADELSDDDAWTRERIDRIG